MENKPGPCLVRRGPCMLERTLAPFDCGAADPGPMELTEGVVLGQGPLGETVGFRQQNALARQRPPERDHLVLGVLPRAEIVVLTAVPTGVEAEECGFIRVRAIQWGGDADLEGARGGEPGSGWAALVGRDDDARPR